MCVANIRSCLTPTVDSRLKLNSYEATTQITHVFCTKVQKSTPFLRDKALKFRACFLRALSTPKRRVFFKDVSPEIWDSFRPQLLFFVKRPKICRKKTCTPAPSVNGSTWAHRTRVQNFGVLISKKWRGLPPLEYFI